MAQQVGFAKLVDSSNLIDLKNLTMEYYERFSRREQKVIFDIELETTGRPGSGSGGRGCAVPDEFTLIVDLRIIHLK